MGLKLRYRFETHTFSTRRDVWSTQPVEPLGRETIETGTCQDVNMPQITKRAERAVSVSQLLATVEGLARVYLLLHRDENARLFSDKQIIATLKNGHDMGVKGMPRYRYPLIEQCYVKCICRTRQKRHIFLNFRTHFVLSQIKLCTQT